MGHLSGSFFFDLIKIILINILLAGDNAVVIAMAVRSLPPSQRRIGVVAGAGGAVVLRIVLTFWATRFLEIPFIKLLGGILILWIAVKLLTEAAGDLEKQYQARSIGQAIWLILMADITMSLDNILAVAAASKGNLALLIVGLGLSIPFVVFASSLLARIMDQYPAVLWLGSAILGQVAGEMVITDAWVVRWLHPTKAVGVGVQILFVALVLGVGMIARSRKRVR
jgi:YjbE family integral membrane protein